MDWFRPLSHGNMVSASPARNVGMVNQMHQQKQNIGFNSNPTTPIKKQLGSLQTAPSPARPISSSARQPLGTGQPSPMRNQSSPVPRAQAANGTAEAPPAGVGIQFEPSRLVIAKLLPGGSAIACGELQPGDLLLAVDGKTVSEPQQARSLIVGRAGTVVTMTFRRGNKAFTVRILRGAPGAVPAAQGPAPAAPPLLSSAADSPQASRASSDAVQPAPAAAPQPPQPAARHAPAVGAAKPPTRPPASTASLEAEVGRLRARVKEIERDQTRWRERERALESELSKARKDAEALREALVAERARNVQGQARAKADEVKALSAQLQQLQGTVKEKDVALQQARSKGREQVTSLGERIKELEEILKDRVATKNGRIVDLNKQLLDCNAEVESLRQDNAALREDLTQTTVKLNGVTSKLLKAEGGAADVRALTDEVATLRARNGELEGLLAAKQVSPLRSGAGGAGAFKAATPARAVAGAAGTGARRSLTPPEISSRPAPIRSQDIAPPAHAAQGGARARQPVVIAHGVSTPQVAALQIDSDDPVSGAADSGDVQQSSRPIMYRPQPSRPQPAVQANARPAPQQMPGWGYPFPGSPIRYL